ncbi:hypothetical protein A4A49_38251 [Nicotiana attenuata]|uniref:DUF4283 domain-containing protein n=1 Tax=Nicotiana attenuata TaxID=49451 RepID=A0A1J6JZT3_NICAT|nr:hypothetical protein A4A49_38251 [Nicotiana attenuata]
MDPPDGVSLARLDGQSIPDPPNIQSTEATDGKLSYATKVSTSKQFPAAPNQNARESVIATQTIHNRMSAVLLKASDYYGIMAAERRLTIVDRFLKPRPQIDRIRSKFKELISIKGSVKIEVYDNYNVFLDFTNEDDFNFVCGTGVGTAIGITFPYAYVAVCQTGGQRCWTPLEMDLATRGKTRPSMAKVRIEIDLLKQQPDSVYVGQIYDDTPQRGFVQKLEYEDVPKYCKHYRKLGHNMINCRVLERKREMEKKDQEAKHGKEVNFETKEDGQEKDNKVGVNSDDQPSDEKRAENQERVQSIKGRTTIKVKAMRKKKVPKKKSKVTFKHVKSSANTKNNGAIEIAMNEPQENNSRMNTQVHVNKSDDQVQNGDDGSTNVTEKQAKMRLKKLSKNRAILVAPKKTKLLTGRCISMNH